jgi:hypothetical protein
MYKTSIIPDIQENKQQKIKKDTPILQAVSSGKL